MGRLCETRHPRSVPVESRVWKIREEEYGSLAQDCDAVSKAITKAFADNDIGDYRLNSGREEVVRDIFERELRQ